ncbi:hypothetical protein FOC1_g10004128 [Fusarium oxysporum f. sp. cubense race 1]|uniref:Uncharacterized protein n=1 Tax=Fusarium oxysporum f. sp. cubense (strain race 1) TaxID=1229664 RepID=N4U2Q7_FUSC1|nr:hypothetical protein FOC1_g10004128 [Fusarium oxysporum f. sp. cubense race 1]
MSTVALSRKRASTPSSPTTNLTSEQTDFTRQAYDTSEPRPNRSCSRSADAGDMSETVSPGNVRSHTDATCTQLIACSSRMPESTPSVKKISPKHRREHEVGYRQAVEALSKLDVLGIATRKMIATVNDIERITKDIDEILEFEAPSFPNVQLKRSCQDFIGVYEKRLASLDPMRENRCKDSLSGGEHEMV